MLGQAGPRIRPMEYRATVAAALERSPSLDETESSGKEAAGATQRDVEMRVRELETELELKERNFQFELTAVRKEAYEMGQKNREGEHFAAVANISGHFVEAIADFRLTRDHYMAQVEREVVRLALTIAERILHREVQMDPLLLSGAVRVALGQLAENTEVRLKVPTGEHQMWTEMLRLMPNLPLRPELVVDERMGAGECTIETHLGTVDIGVRAQLAEIERGFFDLLEHREQISSVPRSQGR